MERLIQNMAKKVPADLRKHILQEGLIDKAINVDTKNTAMEYLFDVYHEFVDTTREHDDWYCPKCRQHVLSQWKRMKTHLLLIENGATIQ